MIFIAITAESLVINKYKLIMYRYFLRLRPTCPSSTVCLLKIPNMMSSNNKNPAD